MKIGIDIDNVIADTYKDLSDYFHGFLGKRLSPHETVKILRENRLIRWKYFLHVWQKKIMQTVSLIEGAAETIQQWHPVHKIYLVTSRFSLFNRQTRDWLKKYDIPFHQLHHAKETTKYKKTGPCDVFIEDNPEECEVLADHCNRVFLFDHPWNKETSKKKNIIRVKNWEEIKKAL